MASSDPARKNGSECIGVIGAGLLGSALVARLVGAGFRVLACDIDPGRLAAQPEGVETTTSAADVASRCPRLMLSLPTHQEVQAVLQACAGRLRPGLIVIDTTTGDPESAERAARELEASGVSYLDATVSGSSSLLRAGRATLMVGGPMAVFESCRDLFAALGEKLFHTGPVGSAAKMKLVTNLVLGLNRAALAEGLALAGSLGLDLTLTLAVMRASPAYSMAMDTKGERMIHRQFEPEARLSQHLKDVRLILALGRQCGLAMPFSSAHRSVLEEAEARGFGAKDNSAIIEALRAAANGTGEGP